jgi:hypothetical protein
MNPPYPELCPGHTPRPAPPRTEPWTRIREQIIRAHDSFLQLSTVSSSNIELWLGPAEYEELRNAYRFLDWAGSSPSKHWIQAGADNWKTHQCEFTYQGMPVRRSLDPGVRVGVTCGAAEPDPA